MSLAHLGGIYASISLTFPKAAFIMQVFNDGNDKGEGWKTDPLLFLFKEMLLRLGLIRTEVVGPTPPQHSNVPGANDYPMFSKDHFEFMLCLVFYKARQHRNLDATDIPILWQTKSSDRARWLGSALLFQFDPSRVYQALPAVGNDQLLAAAALFRRVPANKWFYKDTFWATITHCHKQCPIPEVILGRAYLHIACMNLNQGKSLEKLGLTPLMAHLSTMRIETLPFEYFWISNISMRDWVKKTMNNLQLKGCIGMTEQEDSNVWGAILRGVNTRLLKQRMLLTYEGNHDIPPPIQMLDYDIVQTDADESSVSMDAQLIHKNLGSAIRQIGKHLIVTPQLLTVLMEFRTTYVKSMGNIQSAHEERESSSDIGLKVNKFIDDTEEVNGIIIYGLPRWREKKKPAKKRQRTTLPSDDDD